MTEIDDEMAVRAATKILDCLWHGRPMDSTKTAREILEAALNPPKPEPEIEVSEAMMCAGKAVIQRNCGPCTSKEAAEFYRAMVSTRLKEAQEREYKRERECKSCNGTGNDTVDGMARLICMSCGGSGERRAQEGAAYAAKDALQGVDAAAPVKKPMGENVRFCDVEHDVEYAAIRARHRRRRKDDK